MGIGADGRLDHKKMRLFVAIVALTFTSGLIRPPFHVAKRTCGRSAEERGLGVGGDDFGDRKMDDVIELGAKYPRKSEFGVADTEEAMLRLEEKVAIAAKLGLLASVDDEDDESARRNLDEDGAEDGAEMREGGEDEEEEEGQLPRLHADLGSMVRWIERSGGKVDATVHEEFEGWTLHANRKLAAGTTLMSIPKALCIFSDPELMENPLLENAQILINSLDKKHWRARLAIALLSERVRPNSFFRAFLRNLPFEFWGMPVFFSTSDFGLMQDLTLMQRTRDRCRFLSEFADNVLLPLQKTARDPFSGNSADVNAFGWGFASASSRALRNPSVVGPGGGAIMVPGIDIVSHSNMPNCVVLDEGAFFVLRTVQDTDADAELTINYGALSNDELLSDYGFTMDNNPNERMMLNCDPFLINSARAVMGQCKTDGDATAALPAAAEMPMQSPTAAIQQTFGNLQSYNAESLASAVSAAAVRQIGKVGMAEKYKERLLYSWQMHWLRVLNLLGPNANFGMTLGCPAPSSIDPRLWAYLRILYASSEEDLTSHGYDPFILQKCGSMLQPKIEAHVIKTMVGMLAVVFRVYGTDHEKDLFLLRTEMAEDVADAPETSSATFSGLDGSLSAMAVQSDDIITDAHRILRNIFKIPHPASSSPTLRRLQQSQSASAAMLNPSDGSVEDMVRLSSSAAVLRPPSLKADKDMETLKVLTEVQKALAQREVDDREELGPWGRGQDEQDVGSLGMGLPVNVREALRYRIRRKRSLAGLIINLGELYKVGIPLRPSMSLWLGLGLGLGLGLEVALYAPPCPSMLKLTPRKVPFMNTFINIPYSFPQYYRDLQTLQSMDDSIEDLLPLNLENKNERRAKIRELMEEVRSGVGQGSTREDVLAVSTKISEKYSQGGLAL